MPVGIVLVHGYSGSHQDLGDLAEDLAAHFGDDAVNNICLPGHGNGNVPPFDQEAYVDCTVYTMCQVLSELPTLSC